MSVNISQAATPLVALTLDNSSLFCSVILPPLSPFSHSFFQRKMMMDLRQLGIADAPALGFGCPTSSLVHDTQLLSKIV